jgi:cytochrome oxidase Cu insertion factor (SCO1/SenC/PrrC family)
MDAGRFLPRLADATEFQFSRANGRITHNLRTLVIDRDFRLRRSFTRNSWTPQELVAELRAVLDDRAAQ